MIDVEPLEQLKHEVREVIDCVQTALAQIESAEGYLTVLPEHSDDTDIPDAIAALNRAHESLNEAPVLAEVVGTVDETVRELESA